MSGFSAQWLALREPLDAASRAAELVAGLATSLRDKKIEVVDLGAGTGANLRYAAPRLGASQYWRLVERDPDLLAVLQARMPDRAFRDGRCDCQVQTLALDLATQLDQLVLPPGCVLTASALLDLVSAPWLEALIGRAAAAAATVWFTLTYDGGIVCEPAEPEDREVQELFNLHQQRDKGFGAALGPAAAPTAALVLAQYGYRIASARSDWHIGPDHTALQEALLSGWCEAACEIAPDQSVRLRGWLARRLGHVRGARSKLQVGHMDMLGRPAADGA